MFAFYQWRWLNITLNDWLGLCYSPDSKGHGANMGPTLVLSAPDRSMLASWTMLSGKHRKISQVKVSLPLPAYNPTVIWAMFLNLRHHTRARWLLQGHAWSKDKRAQSLKHLFRLSFVDNVNPDMREVRVKYNSIYHGWYKYVCHQLYTENMSMNVLDKCS